MTDATIMKCTLNYKNQTIRNPYQTGVIVFLCALSIKPVLLYSTMNQHQCATCLELHTENCRGYIHPKEGWITF